MVEIQRQSPVRFAASPASTEVRDNWTVTLAYEDEGSGPWITDLACKTRWDLQDKKIGDMNPCGFAVPDTPGQCTFSGGTLVNRMNGTQASIYHLGPDMPPTPEVTGYTDVSESTVFFALFGPNVFRVAEKLTNLDILAPGRIMPFLLQGPFCHVPCQVVVMENAADGSGGFLLTCSRGYGDSMIHAIMEAGEEFDLRPAGENRFTGWLEQLKG
jgi:hypothetical protein